MGRTLGGRREGKEISHDEKTSILRREWGVEGRTNISVCRSRGVRE